ncbi:MAG TPA: DUF2127 domain-containing protein [Chloroflexia bacterium]|jgi:uncharacterized membrane protein (DUF2068 family)
MSYKPPPTSPLPPLWEPSDLPPLPPLPSQPERPTGVTVLAVLNFIGVALSLLLIVLALLSPTPNPDSDFLTRFQQEARASESTRAVATGVIGALVSLPMAVGLWRLRPWARVMAIVVYGASIVFTLCATLSQPITGGTLISLAIPAGVIVYLLQPHVEAAFEPSH